MTAIEFINKHYNNPRIILKDRGNRGYYIKYSWYTFNYKYDYISKKEILKHMLIGVYNERKKKLITLKIMYE